MKKEMLINVLQQEESRIAIVEDGVLEELYVERASQESYVGNIYKGKVVNIEAGIQAVFIDFGIGRNGFLHLSDVDPVYYKHLLSREAREQMDAEEGNAPPRPRKPREKPAPRLTAPESVRSDPHPDSLSEPEPPKPPRAVRVATPIIEDDDDDDFGFGIGLHEDEEPTTQPNEPVELEVAEEVMAETHESPLTDHLEEISPTPMIEIEEEDFSDFGIGLLDDEPEHQPEASARADSSNEPERQPEASARADSIDEPDTIDDEPEPTNDVLDDLIGDIESPSEKPKPRRKKSKTGDAKSKAKPKRKKKADAEETSDDDKPKPMEGAERRTSSDDEPEIKPFFEGDFSDDFDINGPNDRFSKKPRSIRKEPDDVRLEEDDSLGFPEDDDEDIEEAEIVSEHDDEDDDEEGEIYIPQVGRGFNDNEDGEFVGTSTRPERGGRGGDRGGRPQRGRSNDRGGRPQRGGPSGGRPASRERSFPRPPIQEIFKRGQEVIVQVIKEGIGTKGPTLSTFISIAGRYLVLMPSLKRVGVSRKIEDVDARKRLREIMNQIEPPEGVGFIVRTAAVDRNEEELHNDLAYLLRLWQVVARRIRKMPAPVEIYRESDMITRTIRDIFTADIDTIWVDEERAFAHASDFLQIVMPRYADRIRFFSNTEPLFNKYRIEHEIAQISNKRVDLPQGGSLIIEQTEALVAIDVNSGNFRAENNAEETAYQMNMLAAKEIARQLRLRDLGGVIVNDFIDMRDEKHRRNVENVLRKAMTRDRARHKVLRISQFGIIEMTRQRIQPSLKKRIFDECSHCRGTGYVKTHETMGIEVMRLLQLAAHKTPAITAVTVGVNVEVAFYLLNRKRREIAKLESDAGMEVQILSEPNAPPEAMEFRCYDNNGNEVRLQSGPPPRAFRPGRNHDRRVPQLD